MDNELITRRLLSGELNLEAQFLTGSNYTFLAMVDGPEASHKVVYKPVRGELPLWDFPTHTLARREVAAYLLSEGLGWSLVPPTVFRPEGPLGAGSVQLFIEHDPELHYFTFDDHLKQLLRPAVLFDLIANNADRKGGHFIFDSDSKIWLIDHGICFHEEDKLRTVVWDFSGEEIPNDLLSDVQALLDKLNADNSPLYRELICHLSEAELEALQRRSRRLLVERCFPTPGNRRRPYPWPPV